MDNDYYKLLGIKLPTPEELEADAKRRGFASYDEMIDLLTRLRLGERKSWWALMTWMEHGGTKEVLLRLLLPMRRD